VSDAGETKRFFSSPQRPDGSGAHPASRSMGLPSSGAEVVNSWSHTSTPQISALRGA
jgi:hypothetical protein